MRSQNIQKDLNLIGDELIEKFILKDNKTSKYVNSFFSDKNILSHSKNFQKIIIFHLQHRTYSPELRPATRIERQARYIIGSAITILRREKYQITKRTFKF